MHFLAESDRFLETADSPSMWFKFGKSWLTPNPTVGEDVELCTTTVRTNWKRAEFDARQDFGLLRYFVIYQNGKTVP
jgi:hypothetical protein